MNQLIHLQLSEWEKKNSNNFLKIFLFSFSQLSAVAIISIPAEIYSFGWQYCLFLPGLFLVTLITNYVSLPVFYCNNIENCYMVKNTFYFILCTFVQVLFINKPIFVFDEKKKRKRLKRSVWLWFLVLGNEIRQNNTKTPHNIVYRTEPFLFTIDYVYPIIGVCGRLEPFELNMLHFSNHKLYQKLINI